jgi:hypothetical protein
LIHQTHSYPEDTRRKEVSPYGWWWCWDADLTLFRLIAPIQSEALQQL